MTSSGNGGLACLVRETLNYTVFVASNKGGRVPYYRFHSSTSTWTLRGPAFLLLEPRIRLGCTPPLLEKRAFSKHCQHNLTAKFFPVDIYDDLFTPKL
jgi:hypothetical protein